MNIWRRTVTRVYAAFDRKVHVGECRIDFGQPLLWALDFNVNPMCSVVAQRRGEEFHVLDEIVINRASTDQACQEFIGRYPHHPARTDHLRRCFRAEPERQAVRPITR